MKKLIAELNQMGFDCDSLELIRSKDGVTVGRVEHKKQSYILKCFEREEFKREIENYNILSSLQIPTIKVLATTDSAILMEDITASPVYRLGEERDLSDVEVARGVARWYKQLHRNGYTYVANHGEMLYDEADYFTRENIEYIREKTKTEELPAWNHLLKNFDTIKNKLSRTKRTLTYNDFYYTNLIVAKDKSSAFMFDYNLLGKGYAYADLRNVISSLSQEAAEAFLEEYGEYDQTEKELDDVVSMVVTLYLACQREEFPEWAQDELEKARNLI